MLNTTTYRASTIALTLSSVILLTACTGTRPADIGVNNDRLTPCPESPNCVGSFEDDKDETHYIEAYSTNQTNQETTWSALKSIIDKNDSAEIIHADDSYIYAEFTSGIMRFVDDTEFMLDKDKNLIQLRSASRLGYKDFNVNRERLEAIRIELEK